MCLDDGPSVQFTGSGSEVEDEDHYTEFNQDQCNDYIQSFESAAVQDGSQYRTITILLQEQQAMLQSIIAKQEKFEAFQSREQMVEDLEKKVATQCPTPASSSDSSPAGNKHKRVVNRDLSKLYSCLLRGLFLDYNRNLKGSMNLHFQNMVAVVHESLEKQFKADERYLLMYIFLLC